MASSRDGQDRYSSQLQLIRGYNKFLSLENRIANAKPDLCQSMHIAIYHLKSFEPRPNSRALGTVGSVIIGCAHSKNQFDVRRQGTLSIQPKLRKIWKQRQIVQKFLTKGCRNPESCWILFSSSLKKLVWRVQKISCGDFEGLTRLKQSLLFSSSLKKPVWRVQKISCGDFKGLTRLKQSLLFSSSLKKPVWRVQKFGLPRL